MKIEFEAYLDMPRREFADLRRELIERQEHFNEVNLVVVPYSQLHLCCIGNAGSAMCSPRLVQQEKIKRRERFLNMEPEEFKDSERYLKIEQMYDDVMYAISNRVAHPWDILTDGQQLWVKLTCLYNHTDDPVQRMQEITALFLLCAADKTAAIPVDIFKNYAGKMKALSTVYPGRVSDEVFRDKINEFAQTVWDFMPLSERQVIEKEQLQGYSCTSDCFKVLV